MPFGLCKAPATFQSLMQMALRGLVESKCLVYLDDVIVFGRTAEEHTAQLLEVLRRLREGGLKVKPEKCWLMKRKVAYLGHIISEKGISRLPNKTSAVREWPTPTCVTELRQFLGLASYYRKFVNGFANHAAPLHRLLEKGAEWDWSKACQFAFDALKYHLTSTPILPYPDFHRQFTVDVDASGDGLGAMLSQREGKTEGVVPYASCTLTKGERQYCATRKETLYLVWALREFRPYFYGQRFLVRTDHSCLRWLRNFKEPEGHVARWLENLAELDFEVEHRAGRLHGNADALSHASCTQCGRLDGLEHCTKVQTHVALKYRAVPAFQKSFVMAFTMHDAVEKQLEQYVNMDMNLCCPNHYCGEADDKIRICASEFSTGLVDRLVVDSYLILRPEKLYQAFTDGPEWVRPPEVLIMLSKVGTWFKHREMYYRAARIAPEKRAALVHYHTNEEVRGVMKALYVQETDDYDGLKSALFEAFGVRTGSERFYAVFFRRKQQRGESMRDYAGHLRCLFPKAFPRMSGFTEAIEVATREKRVWRELTMLKASVSSVKAVADQEDLQLAVEVTEAAAATVTTQNEVGEELAEVVRQLKKLLMTDILAAAKRTPPQQRRRREKKDRRTRNCQASPRDYRTSKVSSTACTFPVVVIRSPGIETLTGLRCNMLVGTGSALTLADEKFMRGSKTLWDVLKPAIQLDTASGDELQVTKACVTKIILGRLVIVQHTVLWAKGLSHKILLE
ncbi:Retrovirus-related Pol polyprotein from transposon [Trichinella patagoniensis]|uniref:RNA-directed DNA polymerase n=1 Tax=Trichinella patagoniensis TaxID=990121 RepID=A0A0V1AF95_9BILA|nr:Retrovirus-related Pol polyprotein from transposon [Trichinella patagoniensis]